MREKKVKMKLPRLHLIEIEDCSWLPNCIREGMIVAIGHLLRFLNVYRPAFEEYFAWGQGGSRILDMASGSGNHIDEFIAWKSIEKPDERFPKICLSDFYPNVDQFKKIVNRHPGQVDFTPDKVNAVNAAPEMARGRRSIFTAFHHFHPDQARAILLDAALHSEGLFIYEPTQRTFRHLISNLSGLSFSLIALFRGGSFTWKRAFFTYLCPLIPLFLFCDGIISTFRSYTREEFQAMIDTLPENDFEWEVLELRSRNWLVGLFPALCVVGRKRSAVALSIQEIFEESPDETKWEALEHNPDGLGIRREQTGPAGTIQKPEPQTLEV
jgi:hypothetical protein